MNELVFDQLLYLEHEGWKSLCGESAAEFYRDAMTEDGYMILANGMKMSRDEVVAALGNAPPWDGYSIDEPKMFRIAENVFGLIYRGTGTREGGEDFTALMTSVYTKDSGKWLLALYTQTPVSYTHLTLPTTPYV